MVEKIEKEQMNRRILMEIKRTMEKSNIKQKDLLNLCKEKGYNISQPELSRILANKVVLTLYPCLAICDVLGIDILRIQHPEKKNKFELSKEMFVTDPNRPELENYLGGYEVLFYTTDVRENKLLNGRLELTSKGKEEYAYCSAAFKLDTKDTDMRGEPIYKRYQGQFLVSPQMGVGYLFLVNNKVGEICTVEFRHRTFFFKQVECRLGLVLTTSTGEKKVPAVHKMVIYRGRLEQTQEEELVHMLKLDNTEMHVDAAVLKNMGRTTEEREFFEKLSDMLPQTSYYTIDGAMLKSVDRKLSHVQISSLFSLLRHYSEDRYTMRLDDIEDEMLFELIRYNKRVRDASG